MLLILPIVAFILFYLILRQNGVDSRRAVLAAGVFWGASIVVITETLSVPRLITKGAIAIFWLGICVVSYADLVLLRRRTARLSPSEEVSETSLDYASRALLIASGVIVLLVLITALIAPPNVWDAMEYHLPRVSLWMSHHSVRFFATPDYGQLIFGPWAEFAMMHVKLLSGSDRFVNLVQFFSFLGCVIGTSFIAKLLGAGTRGQILAALLRHDSGGGS